MIAVTLQKNSLFRFPFPLWTVVTNVNMTSLEVVRTVDHIRRFLRRYLVLKIKPSTGQTPDTTDKRERRKNMAKSKGPNSDCNIEIALSLKSQ